MASEPLYFDDGVLTVENAADSSTLDIAGIQGITIIPGFNINEYYTADSALRAAAKQNEHNVQVDIDYAFFDTEAAKQWLGGEGTTASTSTADTSDPLEADVDVVTQSSDGTFERTAAVDTVVFEEWPIVDGSMGEFEEFGLSGSGRQVSNLDDTSP